VVTYSYPGIGSGADILFVQLLVSCRSRSNTHLGRCRLFYKVVKIMCPLHSCTRLTSFWSAGAHTMDKHFFESPLRFNLPVNLGLIGVWNSSFLGYSTRAILPCTHWPLWVTSEYFCVNLRVCRLSGADSIPCAHSTGFRLTS
jgi:hypothetical protein